MKVTTSASYSLPIQLKILEKARQEAQYGNQTMAINILTITSLCTFLESYISKIIKQILTTKKINTDDAFTKNIFNYFEEQILTGTFKTYEQLSSDILGKQLSSFTKQETWESIKMLFNLRNQIVHGREFSIEFEIYGQEKNYENCSKGFRTVIEFLLKKKLMTKKHIDISTILTNTVVEHFILTTKEFSFDLTTNAEKDFSIDTATFRYLLSQIN